MLWRKLLQQITLAGANQQCKSEKLVCTCMNTVEVNGQMVTKDLKNEPVILKQELSINQLQQV